MADIDENIGGLLTHRTNRVRSGGAPAIVVLKPPAKYDTLDLSNAESVKLWIVNRIFFYISSDNKQSWKLLWNSIEGLTTSYKHKGDKVFDGSSRLSLKPIAQNNYHVFFSQKALDENSLKSKYKELIIPDPIQVTASLNSAIPIPYPNIGRSSNNKFNHGILKSGLRVIKVPLEKISSPFSTRDIEYWIKIFYLQSKDSTICNYRSKYPNISAQDVIKYITHKAGDVKASISSAYRKRKFQYFPSSEEEESCFIKGWVTYSRKTKEETGEIKEKSYKADFSKTVMDIHKMPATLVMPLEKMLSFEANFDKFKSIFNDLWQKVYTDDVKQHNLASQQDLLNKILNYSLKKLKEKYKLNFDTSEVKKYFNTYSKYGMTVQISKNQCALDALQEIAETHNRVITKHISTMASHVGRKPSFSSWKKVYFASGSDAFSEEEVPRHVFAQILSWWNTLDRVGKEFILTSSHIEVIGYSSAAGSKGLNKRLREDRAWKTARSLQLILEQFEGPAGKMSYPLEKVDSVKEITPSNTGPKNIYHYDEVLELYPKVKISESALDNSKSASKKHNRQANDDSKHDRCVSMIFHHVIDDEDTEKTTLGIKSTTAVMAFPASRVSRLATIKEKDKENYRSLMYLCPAYFEDGPGTNEDLNNLNIM